MKRDRDHTLLNNYLDYVSNVLLDAHKGEPESINKINKTINMFRGLASTYLAQLKQKN